ncbi:MAG TPA: twin-arginine translocase TatA/TatE family subunit [Thermoanaerobaculia bacterium]|nr:twin-arginine translocase TatA/TatE family subunit [Thermoanaerobaculia bacterium]
MPSLGPMELILIFLIVIILFGSSRLAGIGKGLGEGIRNFKKGMKGDEEEAPRRPERLDEKPDTRNS